MRTRHAQGQGHEQGHAHIQTWTGAWTRLWTHTQSRNGLLVNIVIGMSA
jgi:hypothetical protein